MSHCINLSNFFLVILTLFCSVPCFGQNTEKLYLIIENSRFGYINETGKTIIKPRFIAAGAFSEGLAPVRLNGTYGYVDSTGTMVIAPKYDIAYSFKNGTAKVFIDGKPFFIDKAGNIAFQHDYAALGVFDKNSFVIAETKTGKYGLINKSGYLIVDTVFTGIGQFNNGIAIVTGLNHKPYHDSAEKITYEVGVIDTSGKWIVKYGVYRDIQDFINGYAVVELIAKESVDTRGVIDQKGDLRFTIPRKKWNWGFGNNGFNQDVAVVDIYAVNPDTVKTWSSSNRYDYKGVINSSGEILFSNPDWDDLTPFSYNRAFVKDKNERWFMINLQGEKVSSQMFEKILFDTYNNPTELPFQKGIAFVRVNGNWGGIDTMGKFTVLPKNLDDIEFNRLTRHGNALFIEEDISSKSENYSYKYGFWNTTNGAVVKPKYHYIDNFSFGKEPMHAIQNERLYYINENGKVLWRQRKKKKEHRLNIDFMNRGYYYASSKERKDMTGLGGWSGSGNGSKQIGSEIDFTPGKLQVIINERQKTKWQEEYDACKIFIANASHDTLFFNAQDSRLYLKLQAKDKDGNWKDIEYLPSSWCGNSYHMLYLAPREYWEFSKPVYYGEYKTTVRAELLYKKAKDQEKPDIIYSNEVEGYINPGQFWNKKEYYSGGMMDPYND